MNLAFRTIRRAACASVAAVALISVPAMATAAPTARWAGTHDSNPTTPVPSGFKASAMTWTSPTNGWVLGAKSCGLKANCARSQVIGTTNGGASWHLVGVIDAQIPKLGLGGTGITEIRFATTKVGWAFAPGLFRTSDGGQTWKAMTIPGGGKQVLSLAVTPKAAYLIASPCRYMAGLCGKGPLTAWRRGLTGGTWNRMAMPSPLHVNVSANVAAYGSTVYVINPPLEQPTQFYASTDGGTHFSARRNPCPAATEHTLIQAAPYSAVRAGFLCDGNPGFSKAVKSVYLSADTGRTFTYAGTMSPWGIQAQLTVSPSGNLAVAAYSDGSFIDINDSHGTTWHQVIGSGDGGAGFNDIIYVSNRVAWVVYGPASMFADYGLLYKTIDAGRHWTRAHF